MKIFSTQNRKNWSLVRRKLEYLKSIDSSWFAESVHREEQKMLHNKLLFTKYKCSKIIVFLSKQKFKLKRSVV